MHGPWLPFKICPRQICPLCNVHSVTSIQVPAKGKGERVASVQAGSVPCLAPASTKVDKTNVRREQALSGVGSLSLFKIPVHYVTRVLRSSCSTKRICVHVYMWNQKAGAYSCCILWVVRLLFHSASCFVKFVHYVTLHRGRYIGDK